VFGDNFLHPLAEVGLELVVRSQIV
jgi:hypothetical protein